MNGFGSSFKESENCGIKIPLDEIWVEKQNIGGMFRPHGDGIGIVGYYFYPYSVPKGIERKNDIHYY